MRRRRSLRGKYKDVLTPSYEFAQRKSEEIDLERDFRQLAKKWKEDTRFKSSIADIVAHPSYLRIIGMSYEALPFILRDLRDNSDYWFHALEAITGENPITEDDRGRIARMKQRWPREAYNAYQREYMRKRRSPQKK